MSVVDRLHASARRDAELRPWLPDVLNEVPRASESTARGPRRQRLVDLLVLAPLMAVAATVHGVGLSSAPQRTDAEGSLVAGAWSALRGVALPGTHGQTGSVAEWWPVWAYDAVTGALGRGPAVAAGRELMVVTVLVSTILLWVLARRLEMPRWAAALAVLLFTTLPIAVELQRLVTPASVAVPCVLAALCLGAGHRGTVAMMAAGAVLAVATIIEPTSLLVVPTLAFWLRRSWADGRLSRVWAYAAAGLLVLTASIGVALLLLHHGPGALPATGPLTATTSGPRIHLAVVAGAGLVAALSGLYLRRLCPLAVSAMILFVVVELGVVNPGRYARAALLLLIPLLALLAGGVADGFVRYRPTRLLGRDVARSSGAAVMVVVVGISLALAPGWYGALRVLTTQPLDRPLSQAVAWVGSTVPIDSVVVTDGAVWVDLLEQGRGSASVVTAGSQAADNALIGGGWVVSTDGVRTAASFLTLAAVMERGSVLATFGTGAQRVDVVRVPAAPAGDARVDPAPKAATPPVPSPTAAPTTPPSIAPPSPRADLPTPGSSLTVASSAAGVELASNPAIELTDGARADLVAGRVDLRVVVLLASLATDQRLGVDGFRPADDGGATSTLPSVRITRVNGASAVDGAPGVVELLRLVNAQPAGFRPDAYVSPAAGGAPSAVVLLFTGGTG